MAIAIQVIISFIKDKISPPVIVSSSLRKSGQHFNCVTLVSEPYGDSHWILLSLAICLINCCGVDAMYLLIYKLLRKKL